MTWVFAVDPGGTTGYALWAHGKLQDENTGQLEPQPFLDLAHSLLKRLPAEDGHLVVERFTITVATTKKSPQPEALEQIGALRYLARIEKGMQLEMQQPSEVMNLVPDWRLRALGWYRKGAAGIHCNDALRHMAWWLSRRRYIELPVSPGA